jgi:ribosomal protein L37AE/L43A
MSEYPRAKKKIRLQCPKCHTVFRTKKDHLTCAKCKAEFTADNVAPKS